MKKKLISVVMAMTMLFAMASVSNAGSTSKIFTNNNEIVLSTSRVGNGTRTAMLGIDYITSGKTVKMQMVRDGVVIVTNNFNGKGLSTGNYTCISATNVTVKAQLLSSPDCTASLKWSYNY